VIDFSRHYDSIEELDKAYSSCLLCGAKNVWCWEFIRCKNCWLEIYYNTAYDNYGEYEKYHIANLVLHDKPFKVFIGNYSTIHFSNLPFKEFQPVYFPFSKFELIKNWHNEGNLKNKIESLLVLV